MINSKIVIEQQVEQKIQWEEAVSIGLELRQQKDMSQWELGDLAVKVNKTYGFGSVSKLAVDIGINKKSLQQYHRVAQAFPPKKRLYILSHRHHLLLAAYEDRIARLKAAADNNLSCLQLEAQLSGERLGISDKPRKCPVCQKYIIDPSNLCTCVPIKKKELKEK